MIYLNANTPYKKSFDLKNMSTFSVKIKSLTPVGGSEQLEPFQITTTITNNLGEKDTSTSSATDFTFNVDKGSNIIFFEYTIISTQNIKVDIFEKITETAPEKSPETAPKTVDLGTTKQSNTRSMSGIMIGITTLIILLGGLVYYFKFIRPGQNGQI